MNRIFYLLVFAVGLIIVGWVGVGYVALSPLALAVTALIAVTYIAGALELNRYQHATRSLEQALAVLNTAPATLVEWLGKVDAGLREPVRLRVEGERVALPGPALTPYLVGLLVLLGMLGTFLGMVATLRGTGLALESATDLQAIRASLAAPVKGLGFAFGTSVAGVGASAMLGLLSALCRRDRARVVQQLDTRSATTLRVFSKAHQREESFRLMQQQAQALPLVADRLQAMLITMEAQGRAQQDWHRNAQEQAHAVNEKLASSQDALLAKNDAVLSALQQHSLSLNDRLAAGQEAFYAKTENTFAKLIESAQALQAQQMDAAQAVHTKLAESTESSYSRLATSVQESLQASVVQSARAAGEAIQPVAQAVFERLAQENAALQTSIQDMVQQQLAAVSTQFEDATAKAEQLMDKLAQVWDGALAEHKHVSETLVDEQRRVNESLVSQHQRINEALVQEHQRINVSLVQEQQRNNEALVQTQQRKAEALLAEQQRLGESLMQAHQRMSESMIDDAKRANEAAALAQQATGTALIQSVAAAQQQLSESFVKQQHDSAQSLVAELRASHEAFAHTFEQRSTAVMEALAARMAESTRENVSATISEIERLVQAAADAPKVAAEMALQVRDKLSESMARDNAMLEERSRMLETLSTLLDAVNHASNEQRTAVDALLSSSSDLLDRIGTQVSDKVEAEADKLAQVATQVGDSAQNIAGLSDAFGDAVRQFSESNTSLVQHLQRVEETLDKSMARSDEQLAYYVAQAREVVDLSVLSQKQIIEELQQLSRAAGAKA